MSDQPQTQPRWRRRLGFFLAFFVVESAVFAVVTLSPYVSMGSLLRIHTALMTWSPLLRALPEASSLHL